MGFSVYIIKKNGGRAGAVFQPGDRLPVDAEISTPFTFPFLTAGKVVLAKDKMGWWNPVGGHIDEGETWLEALKREAYEEAGVMISDIQLFGYVLVRQEGVGISGYPPVSVLPMTRSRVERFDEDWRRMETLERKVFALKDAREVFELRDDNHQMAEIFDYLVSDFLKQPVLSD